MVNNKYVAAENAGQSALIANRTAIGPWETFDIVHVNSTDVHLRAHANNKFVCAEAQGSIALVGNRDTPAQWETFQLLENGDGTTSLRARANGKVVTAENAGSAALIANRDVVGVWEKFYIERLNSARGAVESLKTTISAPPTTGVSTARVPRTTASTSTSARPSVTHRTSASAPSDGAIWRPSAGTTWQWQLSGTPDLSLNVGAYDVDWQATSAATVASIHATGAKAICYVDVGAVEKGRPDSASFPASVQGKILPGWDEALLDIRQLSILVPIQAARFRVCAEKGFDGVELDVDEGFAEDTGFGLTMADQIAYNTALIKEAHKLGLAAGLKNGIYNDDPAKFIAAMEPITEYVIIEECASAGDCSILSPYIEHNKAVFHAEYIEDWNVTKTTYQSAMKRFCPVANDQLGFSSILTETDLSGWRVACP